MGCCGDEEDDEMTKQLIPAVEQAGPSGTDADGSTIIISPMNSNFSALVSRDILRCIFERLQLSDLARAACVCRGWKEVASDREMQVRAFMSPWKLKHVIGSPSSGSFWRDNSLSRFAISHRLLRADTVAGLAVRYSVQVIDIKRLNNMISDHGIYSRERLLIPVSNPKILQDGTCYIELDTCAKREVAVFYLEGAPVGKISYLTNKMTERGKKKILESMKRSMQVDDGTAEYYLSISNGDPRAAFSEFSGDLQWEQHTRAP